MFSRNAHDVAVIATTFGGFDWDEIVHRSFLRGTGEHVSLPTLVKVLQEIKDENDAK